MADASLTRSGSLSVSSPRAITLALRITSSERRPAASAAQPSATSLTTSPWPDGARASRQPIDALSNLSRQALSVRLSPTRLATVWRGSRSCTRWQYFNCFSLPSLAARSTSAAASSVSACVTAARAATRRCSHFCSRSLALCLKLAMSSSFCLMYSGVLRMTSASSSGSIVGSSASSSCSKRMAFSACSCVKSRVDELARGAGSESHLNGSMSPARPSAQTQRFAGKEMLTPNAPFKSLSLLERSLSIDCRVSSATSGSSARVFVSTQLSTSTCVVRGGRVEGWGL